ncbi:hypothetical protein ACWGQ5_15750 [Streptomyces sp. NPDC055722]
MSEYDGHQYVGVDLHRRRSVIVRQTGVAPLEGRAELRLRQTNHATYGCSLVEHRRWLHQP